MRPKLARALYPHNCPNLPLLWGCGLRKMRGRIERLWHFLKEKITRLNATTLNTMQDS